jgi:SAM-dependent methyltransferase
MSATSSLRLNLGCGRDVLPGWINLDHRAGPGIDVVADLDDCARTRLPFDDDSVAEVRMSHVIEHLRDTLPLMAELHRVVRAEARLTIHVPHGASDDAWEDPTHVRAYFPSSFSYFSQPYYWRADYGYRGDWQPEQVLLMVPAALIEQHGMAVMCERVLLERNLVTEMVATLHAVKPIRAPDRALIVNPQVIVLPR